MNKVCLLCDRISPNNNLFCQDVACPAEMAPFVLDYGEWLGDIEIIRPRSVLRSSVLYEAQRNQRKMVLKVAHPGHHHTERLKREATFLRYLTVKRPQRTTLPTLRAPHDQVGTAKNTAPYGKAMLQGHLLYFCVFEHVEGEPLRDVLVKNPQLWIYHIGWLMIELATAIQCMHTHGALHYGLSPEAILVRFDEQTSVPHIVLADLGIISDHERIGANWYPTLGDSESCCVPPAYTAPELIGTTQPQPNHATDVYGLGLILYELLIGQSMFSGKLRSDADIYEAVRAYEHVQMNRFEDVGSVADIAMTAVSRAPADRYQRVADLVTALQTVVGSVPRRRRR